MTARKAAVTKAKGKKVAKAPKVSVIMPTYNRAHLISRSIKSILDQTLQDWELIIISDGSTDNTREVVARFKDPRIRFFHKKNGGPASARNHGLRRAKGRTIAYCDDDDTLLPYHLKTLSGYLDRHPEAGWVRGHSVSLTPEGKGYMYVGFLWALLHRRSLLQRIGMMDEKLLIAEDTDFILRCSDKSPSIHLNTVINRYVKHNKRLTLRHAVTAKRCYDRVYFKRVNFVCKNQGIEKENFALLVRLLLQKEAPNAARRLAEYFRLQRRSPDATYLLGWTNYGAGNLPEAARVLKALIRTDNTSCPSALRGYACAFLIWISSESGGTIKTGHALPARCDYPSPLNLVSTVENFHDCLNRGEVAQGLKIIKSAKNRSLKAYLQGVMEQSQGDHLAAKRYFNRAKHLESPLRYRLRSALAKSCQDQHRYDTARRFALKAKESAQETFGYPVFHGDNFRGFDSDKFWDLANRFFLLVHHPFTRIL